MSVAVSLTVMFVVQQPAEASMNSSPGQAAAVQGDANCDTHVDSDDALAIIEYTAASRFADECLLANGNTICDDDLNVLDALFVLRYVEGTTPTVEAPCPNVGDLLGAPDLYARCDPLVASLGIVVTCSFSATTYAGSPDYDVFLDDGEVAFHAPLLSASCPPGGVPCIWSRADNYEIVFTAPGEKTLGMAACRDDGCFELTLVVTVTE